jgi:hypothetical protein
VTEKTYSDFIFEGEVLLPKGKANSGFMFRAHVEPNKVLRLPGRGRWRPQARLVRRLYDEGRRMWFISPIKGDPASVAAFKKRAGDTFKRNDWNTYRITCKGNKSRSKSTAWSPPTSRTTRTPAA